MMLLMNETGTNEPGDLVSHIFSTWKKAELPFVVLRNYEGLPEVTGNDVDVMVAANRYAEAIQHMNDSAEATGFTLFNKISASGITALYYKNAHHQVHFDVTVGPRWRFIPIISADAVLEQRLDAGLFDIPQPVHEAAVNLLYNLLLHKKVKDKYKTAIQEAFRAEPERAKSVLEPLFGPRLAQQLISSSQHEKWSAIEGLAPTLRLELLKTQVRRSPTATLQLAADYLKQLVKRAQRPPGLTVAFIGPDGSGKSSVAADLAEELAGEFVNYSYIHGKPSVLKPKREEGSVAVTDPHALPARGKPASFAYFLFHLSDFILGGVLRLRARAFKKELVIIDRYYYDFFVDLKRYRLDIPNWLVRLGYRLVVKPDLVFYLDADPEVLQRRKQEVPLEETARQRKSYLALAQWLPQAHILDASQPQEAVVQDAKRATLSFLVERVRNG